MAAHDSVLTETTLSIVHTCLAHVIGGSTDIINVSTTIHLRCLSLLDSLLVYLGGIWVEAPVASGRIQLLLVDSRSTTLLCLRV